MVPDALVALQGGSRQPAGALGGRTVHGVAGIGNPERFFGDLRALGMEVIPHPLPDHAVPRADDLQFGDDLPVLMTEKDAVKCGSLAAPGLYFLEVSAELDPVGGEQLLDALEALARHARR
jgi:tetraacyldisaccharide 4'-kinase